MEVIFKYQNQDYIIKYNEEPLKDLCKKFATDKSLDINKLFFYHKGEQINLNENDINNQNQTLILNAISNDLKNITIKVFTEIPFIVKYIFKSSDYFLSADKTDLMQNVLDECAQEQKLEVKKLYFLKNGKMRIYNDLGNLKVDEFANKFDKEQNMITIPIYDFDRNTEEEQNKILQNTPVNVDIKEYPNMFKINFTYLNFKYYILSNETDKIKEVFSHSQSKGNFNIKDVYFIYKGEIFFYNDIEENITVNDFANPYDRGRKEMEIKVNKNDLKYEEIDDEDEDEKKKVIVNNISISDEKQETLIPINKIDLDEKENEKKNEEKSELFPLILDNSNINNSTINNQIDENPFHIIFFLEGYPYPLKVKETDKMKDIFKKYAKEVEKNLKHISFIYNEESYNYKKIKNETVNDIVTDCDKNERVMHITVAELKKKEFEKNKTSEQSFFTKNFIILFIQYFIILIIDIFGFAFKFNESLVSSEPTIAKYIPLFLILIIFIIFTKDFRNTMKKTIFFVIFFPIMMIIYTLLLSELIEPKYIITGISLIFIYILSLRIHFLIFQKSSLVFLLLSAAIPSFVAFLLFSFIWIKDSLGIFIIFVFWVATIIYYILWIFVSLKSIELNEYFYTVLIFDYGILLGFPYFIIFMFDHMNIYRPFKIFFILLYQYLIIDMIVWIYVSQYKIERYSEDNFLGFYFVVLPITFILNFVFLINYEKKGIECLREGFWMLYPIFYVPLMIAYYTFLAFHIKEDYVYCFIFEIFFILISLSIYTFIIKEDVIIYQLFLICLASNVITLIPFYFIFINDGMSLLYISLIILGVDIYLCVIYFITDEKIYTDDDQYLLAIIVFNYILF